MSEIVIRTNATKAAIVAVLRSLPKRLTQGTISESILTRCGLLLLKRFRYAFVVKSGGGTDEAGDRWAPLSPKTIAYRRKKYEAKKKPSASAVISQKRKDRWWALYRKMVVIFNGDQKSAAKFAWIVMNREENITFDKYKSGKVPILHDTGTLLKSLTPGSASKEQVFRITGNRLEMGSRRKGAAAHHYGAPSRNLPQRRLWPAPKNWPASWWNVLVEEARSAIVETIVLLIKNA